MGVKISALPQNALPYSGSEEFPLVQGFETRAGTLSSLVNYLSGDFAFYNRNNKFTASQSIDGDLTVTGVISATIFNAVSANFSVIDIKQYELSGFSITGDLSATGSAIFQGSLSAIGGGIFSGPSVVDVSTTQDALRVTQRGTGMALRVEDDTNVDSTPFAITSSGTVGIGTDAPNEKLTVIGNISATSGIITSGTGIIDTSSPLAALRVTQRGTGNALVVEDETTPDSTSFVITSAGSVGIRTSTPNKALTINGEISANNIIWDATGSSANWNNAYSSVASTSANWNNAYSSVASTSANWSSNYTTTNSNSANWSSVYTTVGSLSAAWEESAEILPTVTNYLSTNNVILSSATILDTLSARSYVNNPTGKTIYVDAATGTDTRTGLSKYDQFKPYPTLSAAVAASSPGDLVYVRAGSYAINSQINLNDKGHLYFEPGSTVSVATVGAAFSFNQTTSSFPEANSIRIQGSADFVLTTIPAGILTIPTSLNTLSPPIVAFECNSITGPDTVFSNLFSIVNGVLSVDAKTIAMTTTFNASNAIVFNIMGTGDVTARIPFVYCGGFVNGSGTAFPGAAARAQINADVWTLVTYNATPGMNLNLIATSFRIVNYNHVGVGAALSWTENTTFESHVFRGITWGSLVGQPNITFASTDSSTTNKRIRLDQTNIMLAATTNSLSSNIPINVGTYGTFASVPATSNVTFKIGSFTVDADVNTY
jgi:hypothetical protein